MRAVNFTIPIQTRGHGHVVDLTEPVQEAVQASGIRTGHAAAMVVGSTAALTTTEFEPGLAEHDLAAAFERLAARDASYVHEETWGDDNGHAHVRASLVGPSLALPIVDGRVPLGTWQQVVLLDFDTRARKRDVVLSAVGDP